MPQGVLGQSLWVRQTVGVHKVAIRCIEAELSAPGWTIGKALGEGRPCTARRAERWIERVRRQTAACRPPPTLVRALPPPFVESSPHLLELIPQLVDTALSVV